MKGICRCNYECYAKSLTDLAEMVSADGGSAEVNMTTTILCPQCGEELELDYTGGILGGA